MNIKYSKKVIAYTTWCGLGFIRGINYYKYNRKQYEKNKPYLYTTSLSYGLFGLLVYGNPFLLPITLSKEIYKLEVDMRNLENEKNSRFYNEIL